MSMEIDTERVDAAVLALLLLGPRDGCRVWKGFDWDAMERLHKKGFISDAVGKAKSVILTEEGQREAERSFAEMFAAAPAGTRDAEPIMFASHQLRKAPMWAPG
jgi:DNA-binding PadR family transcriptional regulator